MMKSLLLLASAASATAQIVTNGDFSADVIANNPGYVYMNPEGWEDSTGGIVVVQNGNGPWGGLDSGGGTHFISIQGSGATLKQTMTGLTPGTTYNVNFLVTHRPNYGNDETMSVTVDGVAIYETNHPEDGFNPVVASFTAYAETHEIAFVNDSPGGDKSVFVDEVSVTAAVVAPPPQMCDGSDVTAVANQLIAFGCVDNEVVQCGYDANADTGNYDGALAAFMGCRDNSGGGLPCRTTTHEASNLHAQGSCPGASNSGGGVGIGFHTVIPFMTTCQAAQWYSFRFHTDYGRGGYIFFNDGSVGSLDTSSSMNHGSDMSVGTMATGDIWGYVEVNDVALEAGNHVFEGLGFEGCCDGHSELDIQLPGGDAWMRVQSGAQADYVGECPAADRSVCSFSFNEAAASVSAAEDTCLTGGGFLASIHSQAEQDLLDGMVSNTAWIGYHDRLAEAGCTDDRHQGIGGSIEAVSFVWMDGTPSDYENWASGEPNDWQNGQAMCDGTGNEDCTEMWQGGTTWNDANCDGSKPFICQTCGAACNPTDFQVYDQAKSAAVAEDECLRQGGHLASAHSQSDADVIQALIGGAGLGTAWIGFHDRDQEAGCTDDRHEGIGGLIEATTFVWTDATVTDYDNWAGGEPNDWQAGVAHCDGTGNEDCGEAWRSGADWNDANCDGNKPYVCGFCSGRMPPPPPAVVLAAGQGEVGSASADLEAITIELRNSYTSPVVLIGTPTQNGDEELVVRITRIRTEGSFDVYADVPHTCGSDSHAPETFGWMVVEEGGIGDLQAGLTTGGLCAGGPLSTVALGCPDSDHATGLNWIDITFDSAIDNPVAVTQLQTHTGGNWVKTRQRNVASTGMQAKMEEDASDNGHNTEIFGWFAMPAGSGTIGGLTYEAIKTPNAVTHNPYDISFSATFGAAPALFTHMQTTNGGDPSHMRLDSDVSTSGATVFVEEETCSDPELNHIAETIGALAIGKGTMGGSGPLLEVGSASADLSAIRITFAGSYSKPIIIGGVPTHNGDEEVAVRIQATPRRMCGLPLVNTQAGETQMPDVAVAPAACRDGAGDGTYFDLYADIPNHGAGQGAICGANSHASEDFSWMITEEGSFNGVYAGHVLSQCGGGWMCPSGGDHSTGFDWVQATYGGASISDPVVISQMQSHTGGDWAKTRHRNVNSEGFEIKMEEDGLDVGHNQELYGFIALSAGTGSLNGLSYEAIVTPTAVTHNPYDVNFNNAFGALPGLFSSIHTFNGGDPSHLRMDGLTTLTATLFVEEETCSDAELGHVAEQLSVLAVDVGVSGQAGGGSNTLLEIGVAEAAGTAVSISFINDYVNPLIFAGIPTSNGPEEVAIRIQRGPRTWCGGPSELAGSPAPTVAAGDGRCQAGSASQDRFDVYADPPHSCGHAATSDAEQFGWMIVEEGSWGPIQAGNTLSKCGNGALCVNGDHNTGMDWVTTTFNSAIDDPIVFGIFQTHTGGNWYKPRQRNMDSSGFDWRGEEDGSDTGHNQEVYGWFALNTGTGELGGLNYEAIKTPNAVTHNPYGVSFSQTFGTIPALFGTMQTANGGDPSHIRQGATVDRNGCEVFVEEETCSDAEMNHINEVVGVFAVETGVAGSANEGGNPCDGLGSNTDDANGQGVFVETCPDLAGWHTTIDQSGYAPGEVCDVLVLTRGTNCKEYCEGQGRLCMRAQDNSGAGCLIDEGGHERQTTEDNGCLQDWNNQICGCSGEVVSSAESIQDRVCEGSAMSIDCAGRGAGVVNIQDASYGRQEGPDVCPHAATSNQDCHAVTSTDIVSDACQGETSCSLSATNGVFGDPCPGTYKYLTVNYDCGGGAGGDPAAADGDLDGDGDVDVSDLLLLLAAFDVNADGDVNGDGATTVTDLLLLLANFGD